ncbi:MAG: ABC transporter substrate-binding protein, partial [Acetobacteraceae bacterium]
MTQNVCITTKEYADSPDGARKLRAILAARREGVKYIYAHPDEAADITAEAYHGDKMLYRRVFKHMIALHYWSEGGFDFAGMDHMVEGLRILNQISGPVDWKAMIDARFLPEDLRPKQ